MSGSTAPRENRVFYGWWILILGSLINAIGSGIFFHSFTVFFLPLKRDFEVSGAAISFLFGAARLEGGVEGPAVGYLIDRFGPRTLIILGAAVTGLGLILLSTVHSFLVFALVYILIVSVGHSAGFYFPVSAAVNNWFVRYRASGFAIITAAGCVGGMVMAPLFSYLILNYDWRTGAVAAGLIVLVLAVPAALPIHRSPEARGLQPDGGPAQSSPAHNNTPAKPATAEARFTAKQALRTPKYWLLVSSITLRILVTTALAVHLVPILVWKGMSEATAAYLVSVYAFGTIIITLAMGWMGDRWNKPLLSSVAIIAAVGGMLALVLSQAPAALYAFPAGLAITMGSTPLNWAQIGDLFGRRSYATLRGVMAVVYGIATFLSPIYAGWMFDRTGSYAIVLVTFSIILLISACLFVVLWHASRPKETNAVLSLR